jgi:hypothetical protein
MPATGSVSGNVITIDVSIQGGFGAGRPIKSALLNVTALSGGRNNASTDIYADLDATRPFDFPLAGVVVPPPTGCKVTGGGAIQASPTSEGQFSLSIHPGPSGKISYRSDGEGVSWRSTKITENNCTANSAHIVADGISNGMPVSATVDVVDNGERGTTDIFSITLSSGYSRSGTLERGNIQVHG